MITKKEMIFMTNEFDIIEHPLVLAWLKEYAKTEPLGFCFLTQGNTDYFRKIWNKSPTSRTSRYDYWQINHLGITLFIYSNKDETVYKVQYLGEKDIFLQDKKIGSYIISFIQKLTEGLIKK